VSERGRDGLAVPGAPARGWEVRAAPIPGCIPELAQARGGRKMRACACACGVSAPHDTRVHLEEIRSQLDVTQST